MIASEPSSKREAKGGSLDQPGSNLIVAAGGRPGVDTEEIGLSSSPGDEAGAALAIAAQCKDAPAVHTCKLRLKVAIFFDGTGNNLDADVGTNEHSNVARLFRAHPENSDVAGLYAFYVPGIGTYFPDIHDSGEDTDGAAFGKYGEARLDWAMQQIEQAVSKHPAANILGLDIALFGFSRGATLARAFALKLSKRCPGGGVARHWPEGGFDARLYFMGLFDTVASVGLPASASVNSMLIAKHKVELATGLARRRLSTSNGLNGTDSQSGIDFSIAFGGKPGADPTPGFLDGHSSWANDLRIPDMVMRCEHFVASHEVRNSFPLDSCRDGEHYLTGVREYVYPGAHSDVGGGYRPGEGGKSEKDNEKIANIPLVTMHTFALEAGVPLTQTSDPGVNNDFARSPAMFQRYQAYVGVVAQHAKNKTVEGRSLAAMKLFNAWRLQRIRERGKGQRPGAPQLTADEKRYAAEANDLSRQIAAAEQSPERQAALKQLEAAKEEARKSRNEQMAAGRMGWGLADQAFKRSQQAQATLAQAQQNFDRADDQRAKLLARKNTLPGQGLVNKLNEYDAALLLVIEAIKTYQRSNLGEKLRPHYANLMEAYTAEFVKGRGLLAAEPEVLAFFDNYVHDSLAAFSMDETLPSDPRCIYIGGDREAQYAAIPPRRDDKAEALA